MKSSCELTPTFNFGNVCGVSTSSQIGNSFRPVIHGYLNFDLNSSYPRRPSFSTLQRTFFNPKDVLPDFPAQKPMLAGLFEDAPEPQKTANNSPTMAQEWLQQNDCDLKFNTNKRNGPDSTCPSRSIMSQILDDPSFESKTVADKELNLSIYRCRREPSTDNKSIGSIENLFKLRRRGASPLFTFTLPQVSTRKSRLVRNVSSDTGSRRPGKAPRVPSLGPTRTGLVELPRTIHFESLNKEHKRHSSNLKGKSEKEIETSESCLEEKAKKKLDQVQPAARKSKSGRRKWAHQEVLPGDEICLQRKLSEEVRKFQEKLDENPEIPQEKKDLLIFLLRFLFNFPIEHDEFLALNQSNRDIIKKFIVDRFFRSKPKKRRSSFLEKRSTFLDNHSLPNAGPKTPLFDSSLASLKQLNQDGKRRTCLVEMMHRVGLWKKFGHLEEEVVLKQEEVKPGVMDFLELHEFTRGHFEHAQCARSGKSVYKLVMPRMSAAQILEEAFDFRDLQSFLKKREILSIVCKRKQKHERRGKRNDEKTKKVFKRVMKNMLRAHKQNLLQTKKKVTSVEASQLFYEAYFGSLGQDLRCFYDPLKRRVKNPRFRSISNDYLAGLKQSEGFVKDFLGFCAQQEKMVFQELSGYSHNLLDKFLRNPGFLRTLEKAKSKFEWVNFELKVAVVHFLFTFQNAAAKRKLGQ